LKPLNSVWIMTMLKEIFDCIRKFSPKFIKSFTRRCLDFFIWDKYQMKSWSQEGEDRILHRIFETKQKGFYVDVGAHHPKRFSNTYLFYLQGWHGINIDAMPGSMEAFRRFRPRDINIEVAVSKTKEVLAYHIFNEPAFNGFSVSLSERRNAADSGCKLMKTIDMMTMPLDEILDNNLPQNQQIDFLSIDVEGLDLEVLESNDWQKYRPKIVLVEVLEKTLEDMLSDPISKFLNKNGYQLFSKCHHTVFFHREE
jgi:FkbM family methyltransferase